MELMICKCGAKCQIVSGQRWNEEHKNYETAYQVACYRCGRGGPISGTREGAEDAWRKERDNDPLS